MIKVVINGFKGRMGQALLACAARIPEIQIAGRIDQGDDLRSVIARCDVVIDFSLHSATPAVAALCLEHHKTLVIGTTGHSEAEQSQIRACQSRVPIVWASNYSTEIGRAS